MSDYAVLRAEVDRLKEEVKQAMTDIAAIQRTDALQSQKLDAVTVQLSKVDTKLDTIIQFVTETQGGKKWLLGIIGAVSALVAVFAFFRNGG